MSRRDLMPGFGAAAAWPLVVRAQQAAMPVIGLLHSASPDENDKRLAAFRKGLSDSGFIAGQNAAIAYRRAEGKNEAMAESVCAGSEISAFPPAPARDAD